MLERLSKAHRNLALAGILALLAWFGWTVRSVLNPLILGYLFAYILRPMVQKLQDRGMGRRPAVNIIFVVFGLSLLMMSGAVFIQARQFVENQIVHVKVGDDLFTRSQKNIDSLFDT
ncbi:MAG: putative PurR-regulated permease PerM, partial [Planctomycetota bacterium]